MSKQGEIIARRDETGSRQPIIAGKEPRRPVVLSCPCTDAPSRGCTRLNPEGGVTDHSPASANEVQAFKCYVHINQDESFCVNFPAHRSISTRHWSVPSRRPGLLVHCGDRGCLHIVLRQGPTP